MKVKKGTPIPNTEFVIGEKVLYQGKIGKIVRYHKDAFSEDLIIYIDFDNMLLTGADVSRMKKLPPIKVKDKIKVKSKKKLIKLDSSIPHYILELAKKEFVVKKAYGYLDTKEEYVIVNVADEDIEIPVEMVKLIAIS